MVERVRRARRSDVSTPDKFRPPVQQRSRDTVERILSVTEALLAKHGPFGTNIDEILAKADCSSGAFYARFRDKDALFESVVENFSLETAKQTDSFFSDLEAGQDPLSEKIHRLVQFTLHLYRSRPGVFRTTITLAGVRPAYRELGARLMIQSAKNIQRLLDRHRDEHSAVDSDVAAAFIVRHLTSFLDQELLFGGRTPSSFEWSDEVLVAELSRSVGAYLGLRVPVANPR